MLAEMKDAATRCVLRPLDASKCVCCRGSAPAGQRPGELTAFPQVPYSWIEETE